MPRVFPQHIVPYPLWNGFTPTLPNLYWDVDSHEERIKKICCELHKIVEYVNYMGEDINLTNEMIQELADEFEKFKESGFIDYYIDLIQKWIDDNFADIIRDGVRQVFFGLTDDGYFCAYVPDSWSEIVFDTGMVYGRSDYGRLILRFDADGEGVIDNTYSYSMNARPSDFEQLVADVENTTRRTDKAYATLFTNMDEVVPDADI